jgi:hypothetical protein
MGDGCWSEWIPFAKENDRRIPADISYGVYRNRLVSGNGEPVPVKRCTGTDCQGLVYIGAAGVRDLSSPAPMRARFTKHRCAHDAGRSGRAKDSRLVRLWEKITDEDPDARMEFQYMPLSSADEAKTVETALLLDFVRRFGEDPDDLWCKEGTHPSIT